MGHGDQYCLRYDGRAIAVPRIGTVYWSSPTFNDTRTPMRDCVHPGLQLTPIRLGEAPSPIRRKFLADFQIRANNDSGGRGQFYCAFVADDFTSNLITVFRRYEKFDEDELAALVTRDSMIGTGLARTPKAIDA